MSGPEQAGRAETRIEGLKFVGVDFNGNALHDGVHRENDAEAVLLANNNTLHTGEGA